MQKLIVKDLDNGFEAELVIGKGISPRDPKTLLQLRSVKDLHPELHPVITPSEVAMPAALPLSNISNNFLSQADIQWLINHRELFTPKEQAKP
jgi:hypothetical protein